MVSRAQVVLGLAVLVGVALASASAGQVPPGSPGPPGGTPPGLEHAIEVKERNAARLLDTPGIAGIGVGVNPAGRAIIRVFTERGDTEGVPPSLEGVPVDRVTTGVIQARAPTDRFPRPVPIGVSSGLRDVATGTLGVRVTDGTNVFALSNNHVYAGNNTGTIGSGIIQPGSVDGGSDPADRIGTLYAFHTIEFSPTASNTMDAALALTSPANVGTSTPADGYGAPSPITTPAFIGQAVQKYGRTTGLQPGTVVELNVTVDVCYVFIPPSFCLQEARFVNQIAVTPDAFSAGGDSGSLIVTQGGNQPVALLFAGGEGRTLGNPIDLVLQRFGVTIDGAAPPDGPPSAPTSPSALAGDASVSLAWSAPTFDGGSPVTDYKIYRGTSPGGESFLASAGAATSYLDGAVSNGTTYYYKVSAVNANGESPLSGEVSATPSDLVPPAEPLPTLDGFNRANENPLSDGGNWANGVNGSVETGLYVTSNALACTRTTTCTGWRQTAQYGPDAEVWARISTLPGDSNQVRLYARLKEMGTATFDGYMLRANQLAGADEVYLERIDNGTVVRRLTVAQELAAGDLLLLRVKGSTLEAWRLSGSAWTRLGTVSDSTYAAVGSVGIGLRGTSGRLDDFGARDYGVVPPPPEPPGAPLSLTATGQNALVQLTWQPPTDDGGSPVTGYRIYRGTSSGAATLLTSVGTVTSYDDTAVSNGTTYYYEVAAENAVGAGARSAEASATPTDLVLPVEPLPILDDFNRPNEKPLSSVRWGDGILGSAERGMKVASSQLASDRSTTATAWWKTPQYGPDSECWATVRTLPGNGNTFRLYLRLQSPGSSAVDGYMLLFSQASGTDAITFYRITNGALTVLSTTSRDLSVGSRLLFRAQGTAFEAWVHEAGTWSRLARITDTTYLGAGHVGVGIRGKTGRLDDFGAR